MPGGVIGQEHEAEHGGEGRASCLVGRRGTDRPDSGPAAEKGPQPQRPAGSDPGYRCSIRLSSLWMEPPPPEEAAGPR